MYPWLFPRGMAGWWTGPDGKSVRLQRADPFLSVPYSRWLITVAPEVSGEPYLSAVTLAGERFPIERRPALVARDDAGVHLEIEAGTDGLGPTYRLYPSVRTRDGGWRSAHLGDRRGSVVLRPNTSIGLYDEWEDGLGVPWALPLLPLTPHRPGDRREWGR